MSQKTKVIIQKVKGITFLIVLICMSFIFNTEASALEEKIYITVKVNNNCILLDALPYEKDNRIFVPVRFVSEALGAELEWIQEEKKVIIRNENNIIELWQESSDLVVNGEKSLMDTNVEILNDRTMIPVRYAAENLGCTVEWDESTYSVLINKKDAIVPAASIDNRSYSDDDLLWLSRIINVEGGGQSIDGKVAIANVVLNRKNNPKYPDTVHDVIFDTAYCVQFPPAHKTGFSELKPSSSCVIAAKMALEGVNNISDCLFFNNVPFKSKSDDELFKKIDRMYYYF